MERIDKMIDAKFMVIEKRLMKKIMDKIDITIQMCLRDLKEDIAGIEHELDKIDVDFVYIKNEIDVLKRQISNWEGYLIFYYVSLRRTHADRNDGCIALYKLVIFTLEKLGYEIK